MTRTARRMPDSTRATTLAQARRGLFIDFESLRDAPPALVGVLCEDSFQQTVLLPSLASAARAKCLRTRSLRAVVLHALGDVASPGSARTQRRATTHDGSASPSRTAHED